MAQVKIYTTDFCPYCIKAKNILSSKEIEYEEVNIHGEAKLRDELEQLTGRRDVPQIFIDGKHIGDDDALEELVASGELDKIFGVEEKNDHAPESRNVIIIGSGPAGFSAALYAARASLKPLLITGGEIGGQLSTTADIENYPGFNGESSAELIQIMQAQAEHFGTEILFDTVTEVTFSQQPYRIKTYEPEFSAKSVIICTGASHRKLNVPGESEFAGRGVSYCSTCDGFFFQNRSVVVVGGGDTAVEETLFLTRFASEIYLVHRRDRLRASSILQERILNHEKVKFIWNSVVEEIQGNEKGVTAVRLKNVKTNEETLHPTEGVFIFIGHIPNTEIFKGQIELNEQGYIITDKRQHTSVPGVFAAGDVQDHIFRQAITSAGTGAAAAIEAEKYIAEIEHRAYPGR
ncbi:thioredoxin-disulfide reductase [Candidatus Poribacteria bacterium]|nr:thioredoxin-disulfide reductase [Candidatus Poribacteria bacterium]